MSSLDIWDADVCDRGAEGGPSSGLPQEPSSMSRLGPDDLLDFNATHPRRTLTARDVTGFQVISPPGNPAIFSTFGGDFLNRLETWREKSKKKKRLERFEKTQWRRCPEFADFCPLLWLNVSWRITTCDVIWKSCNGTKDKLNQHRIYDSDQSNPCLVRGKPFKRGSEHGLRPWSDIWCPNRWGWSVLVKAICYASWLLCFGHFLGDPLRALTGKAGRGTSCDLRQEGPPVSVAGPPVPVAGPSVPLTGIHFPHEPPLIA